MATPKKSNRIVTVDMTGVNSRVTVDEGDHEVKLEEVELKTSESSGNDYLSLTFVVRGGEFDGSKLWHNCSLMPKALFNLKAVMVALGMAVPSSVLKLNLADMEGRSCGVTVAHEVYEGKKKARITDFFPSQSASDAEEEESTEETEEEAAPEVDLDSMSLPELVAHAKAAGADLKGVDLKKRAALVAAITALTEV
jgi:hypothetical protein